MTDAVLPPALNSTFGSVELPPTKKLSCTSTSTSSLMAMLAHTVSPTVDPVGKIMVWAVVSKSSAAMQTETKLMIAAGL